MGETLGHGAKMELILVPRNLVNRFCIENQIMKKTKKSDLGEIDLKKTDFLKMQNPFLVWLTIISPLKKGGFSFVIFQQF